MGKSRAKKKGRAKRIKTPDVQLDSVRSYRQSNGTHACVGVIGTHTVHRTAGNATAASKKVQRVFNQRGEQT